jgi:signal transduction histidine kinase
MLMQSPLPIAVFRGPELVCELANGHVVALLARRRLVGRPLAESVPEVSELGLDSQLRSVLATGGAVVLTEQPLQVEIAGEHHETYWNYSLTPLHDSDGKTDRVMAVGVEVTDEVMARRQMEVAIALKDQFLGLVSHELRTPISTVVANALVLRHRGELLRPEDRDQALEDIATEGQKLQKIIENLLMLTRMEAASGPNFRPVAVQDVVSAQVQSFKRQAVEREVAVSADGNLPSVSGQEDLIAIVVANLLGNANKYSPHDSLIEVDLTLNPKDEVEVHVRDRGIGIAESELPNLFTPFYRTGVAKGYAAGMGLGLAVCKRIVEAHGGRIWAERRPEGGSDFAFTLPVSDLP